MPEPAEPPAQPTEELDPFAKKLLDSFDKVLPPKPAPPEDIKLRPVVTLGEAVVATKAGSTEPGQKTLEEIEAEKAAAEKKVADEKAAAEKATADKLAADKAAEANRIKVRRKPEVVDPPPQAQPNPPPPPPELTKIDEEWEKGLIDEEREELTLARYAESKGHKGVVEQTTNFLKGVAKFIEEHPEAEPDGEEFQKFIADNKPKIPDRRRLERQMISEEAAEAARRTMDPVIQQQAQEIRRIQAKPAIDEAPETIAELLVTKPEVEGIDPVDKDVVEAISSQGYEKAKKLFPTEAPIVMGAMNAARAYAEIVHGTKKFNPQDNTHAWLAGFLVEEGNNMRAQSKEVQTRGAKSFLPVGEFNAAVSKDPNARNSHWTWSEQEVRELIANRALLAVNESIKEMKEAGWERKKDKVSAQPGNGAPADKPAVVPAASGSPRAGGSSLPGATDTSEATGNSEHARFFNKLVPGLSKELGIE